LPRSRLHSHEGDHDVGQRRIAALSRGNGLDGRDRGRLRGARPQAHRVHESASMKRSSRNPKTATTTDRLREVGVFGALSDVVLEPTAKSMGQVALQPGHLVFAEGDAGREMYVVLDGEVEVLKRSRRGRDQRVAILGPNDAFGEMSIIDVQPRSATVRTLGPTRLL